MRRKLASTLVVLAMLCALAVPAGAYGMGKVGERNLISAGDNHTAAIDAAGNLWLWGDNRYGQLGDGTTTAANVPLKVMDGVSSVALGGQHSAALKADGSLWTWGSNECGQLGNGTTEDSKVPVKVLDHVAAVSAGRNHTAAIKTDGTLWVWGKNANGQVGDGTGAYDAKTLTPVRVLDGVTAVSCGSSFTAAVRTDGSLWTWGADNVGQLGSRVGPDGKPMETNMAGNGVLPGKNTDVEHVRAVSARGDTAAAIGTDGTLWTWGDDSAYQLGRGMTPSSVSWSPIQAMEQVEAVGTGLTTAVIKADGSLWVWGYHEFGEVGAGAVDGTHGKVAEPAHIIDDVAAVQVGDHHIVALKTDGSLWTWGMNKYGQLGNGGAGNVTLRKVRCQDVPVEVTGIDMPLTTRLSLDGGTGVSTLWAASGATLTPPANPTKPGYSFGGWYTDEALATPWNFNDGVTAGLKLYARWIPLSSTAETTTKSRSAFTLDGKSVSLDAYTLKADSNGGDVTFVKLRDVAKLLDGTAAQCNVDWKNGAIQVTTGAAYTTPNGTELQAIDGADGSYRQNTAPILFDGTTKPLEGIVITDGAGGGHTFFKLRDLGRAVGFYVGWDAEKGVFIETDRAYSE